jgi:hypothetical protein
MGDPIVAFPLSSLGPAMAEQLPTDAFVAIVCEALAVAIVCAALALILVAAFPKRSHARRFVSCFASHDYLDFLCRLQFYDRRRKGPHVLQRDLHVSG